MKKYRMILNGHEIGVCAKTMNISRKRCTAYLNRLMTKAKQDYGSSRFFWADVIMLNMLTNRILYHADPYLVERILTPRSVGTDDE